VVGERLKEGVVLTDGETGGKSEISESDQGTIQKHVNFVDYYNLIVG
jgi:hypothetical protein